MTAATQSGGAAGKADDAQDISAWKQRYETLTTASGQLVYEYDSESGHISWTGNLAAVTGYEQSEMAGGVAQWTVRIHADDREQALISLREAERAGSVYEAEYRFLHKDGRYRWIRDRGCFLPSSNRPTLMIGMMQDVTRTHDLEQELERQIRTDALTGALNRRHFLSVAEQEFARATRYSHSLSVLMLNVDEFEKIHSSHSEQVGEQVLQQLAELCWENLRHVDSVGRLNDDEFAILLPETDEFQSLDIAGRLHKAVEHALLPVAPEVTLRFTVSIGVASLKGDADMLGLLRRAESALHEARKCGRNRICKG